MILNQLTLPCVDYDQSVGFYKTLGLVEIVSSPPAYARFEVPDGQGATLSLHKVEKMEQSGVVVYFDFPTPEKLDQRVAGLQKAGVQFDQLPKDESWQWREARLCDPSGNIICLMYAGTIRRFPPWRVDGRTG